MLEMIQILLFGGFFTLTPEPISIDETPLQIVFSAICILGLEFAHSDPGFLVKSNAAFGWIALFSLPHQNLTLVGFSDATLSR